MTAATLTTVKPHADSVHLQKVGTAAEALTAGFYVYAAVATGKWTKAVNSSEAAAKAGGMAMTDAIADGAVVIMPPGGKVLCGGATEGETYFISATAGKGAPAADFLTNEWVTLASYGRSDGVELVLKPTGSQHA